MDVVIYPHPSLRRGGKRVETFDQALRDTAKQMFDAMYVQRGVGLAAPQVDIDLALLVLNPTGERGQSDQEMALVNPKIISRKGKEWGEEGCLSFPGIYGEVERSTRVVLAYQDLGGDEHEFVATDFLARVIQHEIDHIEGVVFTDRMS
ncbi:MAG: peptide deformylase, partial [Planctomycetes bacterium]|nr:peptide deformylase [Planctomycetota bacterium]